MGENQSKVLDLVQALEDSLNKARRPDPGREAPDGCEFVAVEDKQWRVDTSGRRCRMLVGRRGCGRPCVARFNRTMYRHGKGVVPSWWHYCEDHLYTNTED